MAQSFTIRRPAEGSVVRETVAIQIPKGSIPSGGYIGVIVNGKFLEAAMPPVDGDNYVYSLDTKGRRIPDGDMDIEIVLYQDYADRAEIVNRSSVRVKLDNYTSIKSPEDGFTLRYKFQKNKELVYWTTKTQSAGTVTQAAAQIGSRIGELPLGTESHRMLYAFDNVYAGENGPEALLRMQALPDPGKNYTYLTPTGESEAKKFYDYEMHPIYLRIDDTGREVWGSVPPYFPMEGTAGESSKLDLYSIFPLPVLPSKSLFPGDTWQAQHLFGTLDLENLALTEKLTVGLVARGTFIGVEWEKGIPCAKFSVQVDAGPREIVNAVNLNNQPGEAVRVSLDGMIWFALDRGVIVKSELTMLQESLVTVGTQQGQNVGAGGNNTMAPGKSGGLPTLSTGGGGGAGWTRGEFQFDPHVDGNGQLWFFRQRTGAPPTLGAGPGGGKADELGQGGGQLGPGFGNRTGGGSGGTQKVILRVRLRLLTELEQ
jgi:hypothetical protein